MRSYDRASGNGVDSPASTSVGLVTNVYERTYRKVLRPGYFPDLERQNARKLDEIVVLINNVLDRDDARVRAEALVSAGEISRFAWVDDWREAGLAAFGLRARHLRKRPFLVDFGLIMPLAVSAEWLLGWDAETSLPRPVDWISPAIDLMRRDPSVFHVSLNWPRSHPHDPRLEQETIFRRGDFAYSYGFSDQLFLVRRRDMLKARLRTFAPAAMVRHAPHPYTFEYRMESYQRSVRRYRATLTSVSYNTHFEPEGVLARTGGSRWDDLRIRLWWQVGWSVLDRLPERMGPRFKRYPTK